MCAHAAAGQSRVHAIDKHVWTCASVGVYAGEKTLASNLCLNSQSVDKRLFVFPPVRLKCGLLWPAHQPW